MYVVTFLHIPGYEETERERVEQFCYTNIYGPFPTQDKALEWAKKALQADIDSDFEEQKRYAEYDGDTMDEKDKPTISAPDERSLLYENEGGAYWSCVHKLEEISI